MVGGGFEPPKALPADLQSAPFDRFGTPPSISLETPVFGAPPSRLRLRSKDALGHLRRAFTIKPRKVTAPWGEVKGSSATERPPQVQPPGTVRAAAPAGFRIVGPASWRRDSNPQPADYKSAALPVELRQRATTATRLHPGSQRSAGGRGSGSRACMLPAGSVRGVLEHDSIGCQLVADGVRACEVAPRPR